jgi:Ala-tRNA(Pro) deacylase
LSALSTWLEARGVPFDVVEHPETFTAAAEARASHIAPEHGAKTVVLHDGDELLLAVVPASERLDIHKLRAVLGRSKSLRLATEDELAARFPSYELGAVPPFGPDVPAVEVIDTHVVSGERVLCSGGDHRHGIILPAEELPRLAGATVADVIEE